MASPAQPVPFHAVLVAAGSSRRLGGPVRKVWLALGGRPVLEHALAAFAAAKGLVGVVVVAPEEDHARVEALAAGLGLAGRCRAVTGGAERCHSVRKGVEALGPEAELVLVHDAARPLVRPADLERVAAEVGRAGAAALASPVRDSLHRAADGLVTEAVPRADLWAAETPQGARVEVLLAALAAADARGEHPTDEITALRAAGAKVSLVQGEGPNPKLTWPGDLPLFEFLLSPRANPSSPTP